MFVANFNLTYLHLYYRNICNFYDNVFPRMELEYEYLFCE